MAAARKRREKFRTRNLRGYCPKYDAQRRLNRSKT